MSTALLDAPPTTRRLGALAAHATVRAGAMGLLQEARGADAADAPASAPPEEPTAVLQYVLRAARRVGIAQAVTPPVDTADAARWERFADVLLDALAESPLPQTEWAGLERVLGAEQLAPLVGVSPSSLRRYASAQRRTPDDVAARLHFLALVVGDLAGSYNDFGVRRWFRRPRTQLDGRAPEALLTGAWDPQDEGPTRVRELAAALLGAPVT